MNIKIFAYKVDSKMTSLKRNKQTTTTTTNKSLGLNSTLINKNVL